MKQVTLPQHETVVKHTFIEFADEDDNLKAKQAFRARAFTAPPKGLETDEEDDDEEEGDAIGKTRSLPVKIKKDSSPACCSQSDEEDESESEEETESEDEVGEIPPARPRIESTASQASYTSQGARVLRWSPTPDIWEAQQMMSEPAHGAPVQTARPTLRHMDTPDIWDLHQMMPTPQPNQVAAKPVMAPAMPMMYVQAMPAMAPFPGAMMPAMPTAAPAQSFAQFAAPAQSRPQVGTLAAMAPGSLRREVLDGGLERIQWCGDGSKLSSNAEKLLSPEFTLQMPGLEALSFRLMVHARVTGGKNGRSFGRANGCSHIFVRCLSSPPENIPRVTLRLTVGNRSELVSAHDFSDKSTCEFQKGDENYWDLKAATEKGLFQVFLEVVEYVQVA
mmetsp:Transcript_30388/g.55093  ORF Transcript_30388/g.55093 Transcript_30388/m.55093 type:complete len:391 (+) Transcript_30388:53-1225(+)|eukprot:CAMPEP_0197652522 /NCGR_PEP_ID=MMETSP1338-20131121/34500_1 /TAXON_ID=43686 ORGANISM="Pelagodinium beii, Strain RCC1491" /NCGR_SAMPLE_ID=MMETSP1338 /ASSEMBLY_ACC=CAM_ASM_000754 /LENGTH=390 /DNA_ID=CAMNT_0043227419 /DNA_START=45 /DNA_END=1217 /DNA_ORIENTATION=+